MFVCTPNKEHLGPPAWDCSAKCLGLSLVFSVLRKSCRSQHERRLLGVGVVRTRALPCILTTVVSWDKHIASQQEEFLKEPSLLLRTSHALSRRGPGTHALLLNTVVGVLGLLMMVMASRQQARAQRLIAGELLVGRSHLASLCFLHASLAVHQASCCVYVRTCTAVTTGYAILTCSVSGTCVVKTTKMPRINDD